MQLKQMTIIADRPHQVWIKVPPGSVPQRMIDRRSMMSFEEGESSPNDDPRNPLQQFIFPISVAQYQDWTQPEDQIVPATPARLVGSLDIWLHHGCFTVAQIQDADNLTDRRRLSQLAAGEYVVQPTHNGTMDQLLIRVSDSEIVYLLDDVHVWTIGGGGMGRLTVSTLIAPTHGVTVVEDLLTIHDEDLTRSSLVVRANRRSTSDIRDDS